MLTTVISVRGKKRDELLSNPNFVYVGRRCGAWSASKWGNPFRVGMVNDPVACYERWIRRHTHLKAAISELRGKTLGCWCGTWKPGDPPLGCHARVLAELANGLEGDACSL